MDNTSSIKRIHNVESNHNDSKEILEPIRRPMTAYFLYMHDVRDQIKKENPDLKIGQISKKIGENWRSLSNEQKLVYIERSKADKDRYEKDITDRIQCGISENNLKKKAISTDPSNCVFPLSRVKRIMHLDNEVKRATKDATVAINKSTELFVAYLVKQSYEIASSHKRKGIKKTDIEEAIHSIPILDWLQDDFPRR